MRKLGITFAAAMLFFATNAMAMGPNDGPNKTLSTQIHDMLRSNTLDMTEGDVFTQVRFTLNKEGEIVVLSVDTENNNLGDFVKNRLNYQKVEVSDVVEGKMYTVAVRFTA